MNQRDENLLKIRPIIEVDLIAEKSPIELFMHQSLRPILKLQHAVLIRVIESSPHFTSISAGDSMSQMNQLKDFIQKNTGLKNQILGLLIGCLTSSEFDFYSLNKRDLDKRMVEMSLTRYLSTVSN